MQIIIKDKDTLLYDEFKFKCSVGKNGTTSLKNEVIKKHQKEFFHWDQYISEKIESLNFRQNFKK